MFPLEDDELLTEGGGLQPEPMARKDVRAQVGDCADDETDKTAILIRYRLPVPLVKRSSAATSIFEDPHLVYVVDTHQPDAGLSRAAGLGRGPCDRIAI